QQLGQALSVDGCALSLWTKEDEFVQCVGLYDAHYETSVVRDWSEDEIDEVDQIDETSADAKSPENLPQSAVPIRGNPVLQRLLDTQNPVVINDLTKKPDWNLIELPLRSPSKALMVVPLLLDDQIIGSIDRKST
ncbi:GAF domain protein, partial [Lyngbya aestuarii BL J]